MSKNKDQLGNNGFILMSKIGKSTTNMHRAFHVSKHIKLKDTIEDSEESSDHEPIGIDIIQIKTAEHDKKTLDMDLLDYDHQAKSKNKLKHKMIQVQKDLKVKRMSDRQK